MHSRIAKSHFFIFAEMKKFAQDATDELSDTGMNYQMAVYLYGFLRYELLDSP